MSKKTVFSGVQPSGDLHLGNYLGAIAQWVEMQDKYNCIFCVVDYHAITVDQDPKQLAKKTLEVAKLYLAAGIDPKKSLIFRQSDIAEHTELAWLLNCTSARISDLNKMTQFKDKSINKENVSVGLFDYPVLMGADILLYQTDIVPVGHDQVQHLELTRTLANRFNSKFGTAFKIPEAMLRKTGARIMSLDDASKKMSKSNANANSYIALTDNPELAKKKIMKAQTDSDNKIKYDEKKKPAISNLLTIFSLLSGETIPALEKMYANKGYGEFKTDLANIVSAFLTDFQKKYNKISDKEVEKIMQASADKLRPIARKTVNATKKKLGIN
jgi:tryptophanyl-tRNA synthetase